MRKIILSMETWGRGLNHLPFMPMILIFASALVLGVEKPNPSKSEPWIRKERNACYGYCPVYQLEIFWDGRVRFFGEAYTFQTGEHSAQLNHEPLTALENLMKQSGFMNLDEDCCSCLEATDMPTTTIEWHSENTHKNCA